MQKSNVETIIKELAKENARLYPESYPIENGEFTNEACTNFCELAKQYFDNRTEEEIERDETCSTFPIDLEDYAKWCGEAINSVLNPDA